MDRFPQNTSNSEKLENNIERPLVKEGVNFVYEQNPELSSIGSKEQYSNYLETIFPESKVKNIVYHGSGTGEKTMPLLKLKYGKKIEDFSEEGGKSYKKRTGHRGANDVGFFFSPSPERKFKVDHDSFSDFYWDGAENYGKHIYPVILNFTNPVNSDFALNLTDEIRAELKSRGYDSMVGTSDMTEAGLSRDMQLIKEKTDLNSIVEYVAFDPEQIYVLGSQQDIQKFKEFIKS